MRAMVVDFGFDPTTHNLDRQYMLGDNLLVAPVFNEEGICQFYLPDCGVWTDIQTGEKLPGGKWYTKKYDYFGLPLFAKPNSIIPFGKFERGFAYDYLEGAEFVIYELSSSAEFDVYSCDGEHELHVKAVRDNGNISFSESGSGISKEHTVFSKESCPMEFTAPDKKN